MIAQIRDPAQILSPILPNDAIQHHKMYFCYGGLLLKFCVAKYLYGLVLCVHCITASLA